MTKPESFHFSINTHEYSNLMHIPPYVDIILPNAKISELDFYKLITFVESYQNDPRLVEMVREAGDGSAKVPYLLEYGETPESILIELHSIAKPHIEYLQTLPDRMQSVIHTLLSINKIPVGLETYGIPALLELDRIQHDMVLELKERMVGRRLAREFYEANLMALKAIDHDWPELKIARIPLIPDIVTTPDTPYMKYFPVFEHNRLKYLYETCVIVSPPGMREFKKYIPPILHRPLDQRLNVPQTGSEDWLIREIGKIGRHITRALLDLIKQHLEQERIAIEARNYEAITRKAHEALIEYIRSK